MWYTLIQNIKGELEEVSKTLSDLNKDSYVDTTDLANLKLYLAGVAVI